MITPANELNSVVGGTTGETTSETTSATISARSGGFEGEVEVTAGDCAVNGTACIPTLTRTSP